MSTPKSVSVDEYPKAVKEAFEFLKRIWPRPTDNKEDWEKRTLEDCEELTPEQQLLLWVIMSEVQKKLSQKRLH
jgi:hypothetical protein